MKAVVAGARGLLGSDIMRFWNEGTNHDQLVPLDLPEFDFTSRIIVDETLDTLAPDIIINAAGVNMIDYLESHPNTARTIHSQAVVYLRNAAKRLGAFFIQIGCGEVFYSTDDQGPGHLRSELPEPQSVYAKTKLESERIALEIPRSLVVRTSALFGEGHRNLVSSLLNAAKRTRRVQVVSDVKISPTWTAELVRGIASLAHSGYTGLYHVACEGAATPFEVAQTLFECKGFSQHELIPVSLKEYGVVAPQSHNTSLDLAGYRELPGVYAMPCWKDAIRRYVQHLSQK
ncbi:MAG: SDR family oxidoreductase [Thermoguttaceae bacterium]|nr:SDR family oxidoreductase [Thermoguttaceae bacterium]